MVADGKRAQVDDQQENVCRAGRSTMFAPEARKPSDGCNREGRHRIYFGFVGILPHGEHECRHDSGSGSAADHKNRIRRVGIGCPPAPQRVRHYEEHERGGGRTEHCAHEVHAIGKAAQRKPGAPHVGEHDERRRAGGVRHAENLRRREELSSIPKGHRRRQRPDVPRQDHDEDHHRRAKQCSIRRRLVVLVQRCCLALVRHGLMM